MEVTNIGQKDTILKHFLAEIRDNQKQKDSLRFRRNIERIGEILSYELSKELHFTQNKITTPLGTKNINLISDKIVLCSVLRAGLPLHQGILNYFDFVENAFISAYRHHLSEDEFDIKVEYLASPSLDGKTLILADPMLATGKSLVAVYHTLKKLGKIDQIHLVSVIAAKKGVEYVQKHFPSNTHLWVATIDDKLNSHGYIIPGLGDAGDLSFGPKL